VTARSGREALRRLLERDFAVILLDVRMPGMDGFETAALIRQRQRSANTPIIFITAFTEEMHVAKGYSLRAVDYIMAPGRPGGAADEGVGAGRALPRLGRAAAPDRVARPRTSQLHQLTLASLAINAAETIDAMVALATGSAAEILEAGTAQVVVQVDGPPRRARRDARPRDGHVRGRSTRRSARRCDGRTGPLGSPGRTRSGRTMAWGCRSSVAPAGTSGRSRSRGRATSASTRRTRIFWCSSRT
jgi:CheY-like chemotaxis protein